MKKNICLILILLIPTFNGCVPRFEQAHLEDFGIVEVIGYDIGREGKSKMTIAYPKIDSDTEAKTQFYSTEIDMTREALLDISKKSDKSIHFGQLRVVLFSEDFARQRGIEHIVKELYQDPVISHNVFIAIVRGNIEDFLNDKAPGKPNITAYLINLLMPRKENFFNPYTTIHDFIYSITNEISDPMTPFIVKENEEFEIKEIAIFKGDKMIDTIAPCEANLLYGLARKKRMTAIKINIEEVDISQSILLEFVQSKVKFRSNKNIEEPKADIIINLKGQLYGYTGEMNLDNPDEIQALQDEIAKNIEKIINSILKKLQKLKVDPIQLGEAFRRHYRGEWSKELWDDVFPEVEFKVKVKFEITTAGTLK